ncbi:DUF6127 family protein [Glacieibacterium sp.]|uniref:DUF6127 family protein n=1 Tax=Glacieibacterium sp. TaxID=2860237 RepID=UPI003B0028F0
MTGLSGAMARAAAEGATAAALVEVAEAASEAGATRALSRIGLHDADAGKDIIELRQLVQGWRDAKTSAIRAVVSWAVRGAIALLVLGLAVRFGLSGGVRL